MMVIVHISGRSYFCQSTWLGYCSQQAWAGYCLALVYRWGHWGTEGEKGSLTGAEVGHIAIGALALGLFDVCHFNHTLCGQFLHILWFSLSTFSPAAPMFFLLVHHSVALLTLCDFLSLTSCPPSTCQNFPLSQIGPHVKTPFDPTPEPVFPKSLWVWPLCVIWACSAFSSSDLLTWWSLRHRDHSKRHYPVVFTWLHMSIVFKLLVGWVNEKGNTNKVISINKCTAIGDVYLRTWRKCFQNV